MAKRRPSGPQAHGAFKALPVGGLLNRMAMKLSAEDQKKKKPGMGRHRGPGGNLTPDQVRAIRKEFKPFVMTYKMLGEKYGVSEHTIGRILDGYTYQDVK